MFFSSLVSEMGSCLAVGSAYWIAVSMGFIICASVILSYTLLCLKYFTYFTVVANVVLPSWTSFCVLVASPRLWYNCARVGGKLYLIFWDILCVCVFL